MSSCVCRRVSVQNLMPTSLVINFTKCSDQQVITNYRIPPTETREIWFVVGSFSTASPPTTYQLNDVTLWPEGCDVQPTPEVVEYFILFENGNIMTAQNNNGIEYQY
jgi:hypothetical protein